MKILVLLTFALLLLGCVGNSSPIDNSNTSAINMGTETEILTAKNGDLVKVDYTGSTEGRIFDTSLREAAEKANLPKKSSYEPLEFKLGAGQVVSGFEKAVLGMRVSEEKTVTLPPKEAYGLSQPELIQKIPREKFDSAALRVGSGVVSSTGMRGTVIAFDNELVTVDFNHPLAGKTLTFRIILREVRQPP